MSNVLIPGTGVPDTRIHRASLWLEWLKFGDRAEEAHEPEPATEDHWLRLSAETGVPLDPDEVLEAASYYAANWVDLMFGERVLRVMPDGTLVTVHELLASLWLDAFEHGIATTVAKHGLSRQERADNQPICKACRGSGYQDYDPEQQRIVCSVCDGTGSER